MVRIIVFLSLLVIVGPACGNEVAVTGPQPSDYTVAPTLFSCGQWDAGPPDRDTALLDIRFSRENADTHALQSVTNIGGRLVHVFQVPVVRAIVPVARLKELEPNWARGVTNADSLVIHVTVSFITPVTEADSTYIVSLGGRITGQLAFGHGEIKAIVGVDIPDSAITKLRALSSARWVEPDAYFCTEDVFSPLE